MERNADFDTCPVDAFEPNSRRPHNVVGNAWKWCADAWSSGPAATTGPEKVIRGGPHGSGGASVCQRTLTALQAAATVAYSGLVAP
ncbi:SUMF1/EgtB/PvdO family nonheme iron enzyme [Streptomyces melanogenes]|uniref:SUMF1/EgtB/PvdO family nonheme iron enzyme n=1 Tax=Streptomyces melanogenes TaxID=67326 RepID=UPI0037A9B79F